MPFIPTVQASCRDNWDDLVKKFKSNGPEGFTKYSTPDKGILLLRDEDGILQGFLTYAYKSKKVYMAIDPKLRRQGLGTALLNEGLKHWNIQAKLQRRTEDGVEFSKAWLADNVF